MNELQLRHHNNSKHPWPNPSRLSLRNFRTSLLLTAVTYMHPLAASAETMPSTQYLSRLLPPAASTVRDGRLLLAVLLLRRLDDEALVCVAGGGDEAQDDDVACMTDKRTSASQSLV